MTIVQASDSGRAPLPPHIRILSESIAAVRPRFTRGDPPIRSIHASVPSKALPNLPTTRIWFLLEDEVQLARARDQGLLGDIEAALGREVALRGNLDEEFGKFEVALGTVTEHNWRRCVRTSGADPDATTGEAIRANDANASQEA